jgi:hypothetical protein
MSYPKIFAAVFAHPLTAVGSLTYCKEYGVCVLCDVRDMQQKSQV